MPIAENAENIVDNDIERFQAAQLVADLRDRDLIRKELQDQLKITSQSVEESKELDLALLELPKLDAEIGPLLRNTRLVNRAKRERLRWLQTFKKNAELKDVTLKSEDLVVFALRECFRSRYRGWAPTFDKHHVIDLIEGCPYHKGGIGPVAPFPDLEMPSCTGRQQGPRVGIADTAIYPHADLVGRYVGDTIRDLPSPPVSSAGHATFIAGLILQRAPDAELVVREVLGPDGVNTSSWDVAVKLMDFLLADVAVLNMSFGCLVADSLPPLILRRAVERLSRSMVLVAAAGNNGGIKGKKPSGVTAETPSWPAAFNDVVAVGALDSNGEQPLFTPKVPLVDLLAPGVAVASTFLPGKVLVQRIQNATTDLKVASKPDDFGARGYATWEGTSFAAANVSGEIAARMRSRDLSAQEALDGLLHPHGEPPGDIKPFPLT